MDRQCERARCSNGPLSIPSSFICLTILSVLAPTVQGWGNSNKQQDTSVYASSFNRDWLYDSSSLSMKLDGCVWGYVGDNEEAGCLEDESEDGTTYWYMMANCKRAQAAYSVYASDSGSAKCNSGTFQESFVTKNGLSEFIYYLQTYDEYSVFNNDYDDDSLDWEELPMCEEGNNGYIGLDCSDDGTFVLNYFEDQYCLERTGNTYSSLNSLNQLLNNYKNCMGVYSYGDDTDYSLVHQLIYYSDSCTSMDSSVCADGSAFSDRGSHKASGSKKWSSHTSLGAKKSWVTKLKYVVGGMFLLASFIMFTGILFTNRRRRRAMDWRRYNESKKKVRSRSKRSEKEMTGRKSGRSASRSRRSRSRAKDKEDKKSDGVMA